MAKRLTDTNKWRDEWFSELPVIGKLVWLYILDHCDHRGVWLVNLRQMTFDLGQKIDAEKIDDWFGGKIKKLDEQSAHIPYFVELQYPKGLKPNHNGHRSTMLLLENSTLDQPLANPSPTLDQPLKSLVVIKKVKEKKTNVYVKFTSHKEMFANLSSNTQNRYLELYPDQEFLERASLKAWGYYHDTNPKKEPSTVGGWTRALSSWLEKDWVKHVAQIKGLTAPAKMDIKKILADMGETIDED